MAENVPPNSLKPPREVGHKRVPLSYAEPNPAATAPGEGGKRRTSTGLGGLSSDLAKLRSEFDLLQQQLHHLPTAHTAQPGQYSFSTSASRRDSVTGAPRPDAAVHPSQISSVPFQASCSQPLISSPTQPPVTAPNHNSRAYKAPAIPAAEAAAPTRPTWPSTDSSTQAAAPVPISHHPPSQAPLYQLGPPALPTQAAPPSGPPPTPALPCPTSTLPFPTACAHPLPPLAPHTSSSLQSTHLPASQQNANQLGASLPSLPPPAYFSDNAVDLAARAVSMLDCPLSSNGMGGRQESLYQFTCTPSSESQAWLAATEVLLDPLITTLCEEGLSKQLQRTKDGATDTSRIQELAGLVKLLRKAVRELGQRASQYVDRCVRQERDQSKQVESMQLSAESAARALEAAQAAAKRSQAGWDAALKAEKAAWGSELEGARFEAARLKRELERVTEERDGAREDWGRADQSRQQAEQELKELRKTASQQMREVAVSQSEAVRLVSDEKAAAERREVATREDHARLSKRLEAATTCVEAVQGELALLQQMYESTQDGLRVKTTNELSLQQRGLQLQARVTVMETEVTSGSTALAAARQEAELGAASRAQLEVALSAARAAAAALRIQADELASALDVTRASEAAARARAQEAAGAGAEREAELVEEKEALKVALAGALEQGEGAAAMLASVQKDLIAAGAENLNLRHQAEFIAGMQADAEAAAAAISARAQTVNDELTKCREEQVVREERLAVLEGEFAALKDVLGEAGGERDVLAGLLGRCSALQAAVATADATRRRMHNELVCLRGNIRVYCRVRPHATPVVRCPPDQTGVAIQVDGKEHAFTFDRVYAPGCSQEEVFNGVSELVQSALDGYHVCLFSYGQTGAGKTFTMQGGDGPTSRGIIPRSVEKIMATANSLQQQGEWDFSMEASFVEVYNNALRDLLGGPNAPFINEQSAIKHDPAGGHTVVAGVSKVLVKDAVTAEALVRRASNARACESTAMNAESSRGHVVFMLYISGHHPPSGTRLQGCLCLVDLAGSERLDRSQVEDARKREACAINASLSSLGDVFAALSARSTHVPYRNSKLTYLLQPCLSGQGKTLMFVNVNPEPASAAESVCSLKFAAKVNGCELGGNGKGGPPRRATASLTGAGGSAPPRSATEDVKRLSLPGLPRAPVAGGATEGATKRQSLYLGAGAGLTGTKRASGGVPPPAAPGPKRVRQ